MNGGQAGTRPSEGRHPPNRPSSLPRTWLMVPFRMDIGLESYDIGIKKDTRGGREGFISGSSCFTAVRDLTHLMKDNSNTLYYCITVDFDIFCKRNWEEILESFRPGARGQSHAAPSLACAPASQCCWTASPGGRDHFI